ncbi:MAG: guanylate kinase [Oscillospiraceae bacterium]|nr:guanylate kinase [Oscillospiraceae bacterium]
MMDKGILIVVSAPSGCGKGTILAEVLKDEKFFYSVSATTRSPRPGETDGVNYHFLKKEQFEELIASGGMLEYAQYCDNYYGTPRDKVMEKLGEGKHVILEIEVQGAMQIREKCPDAVFIFIAPPSVGELRNRLSGRGTETAEVIEKRVSEAAHEISFAEKYDYVIVNDRLEEAIEDFRTVVRAEELKSVNQKNIIDEVLKNA